MASYTGIKKITIGDNTFELAIPTITLNGAANTTPSFYAPTVVGTSGYFLKSNGSGAPSWAALPADEKVSQTNVTNNSDYRVLLSNSANDNTETAGVKKNVNLKYNPNTTTLTTNTIKANRGFFNFLEVEDLTTQNATVMGLLDVKGNLHTNSWTNSNIATIQGNFYIAPTIVTGTSSTDTGVHISAINNGSAANGYWTLAIGGTNILTVPNLESDGVVIQPDTEGEEPTIEPASSYNAWSSGSKVMVTGSIKKNGVIYPLGTLKGELSGSITTNGATITKITDNINNNPSTLQEYGEGDYGFVEIKISLYQRKYGNSLYPLGILMSAEGRASKSFIDIYGGAFASQASTIPGADSDYGGLAIPNVRIGNLRGLPSVGNQTPTGWGIYTDNGYFKGTIVANTGEIGRFTIANDLYSGQLGEEDSVWVSTGTQQTAIIGGAASPIDNWAFTAGNKFGVTTSGDLYASNAVISGTVTITNNNSNIFTKDEAEKVTNTVQNTIQASIEDISKVINVADWILEYGNCEPTDDTEMQNGKLYFDANKQEVIPEVNPHLQYYYELYTSTWTITEDVVVDIDTQYFERNGETGSYYYTPIQPAGNENPHEEQWYELSNDTYQLTNDNSVENNKLYFLQIIDENSTISYQLITEYIPNPSALGLYELISVNKSISNYINTHVRLDNGAIIIQADNTEASISISLNDGILLKNENGTPIASFSDTIVLGNRSEMHLELSPGDSSNNILPELGFYDGYTKVAYVNSDTLNINRGEIKEKLRIGQFEWRTQGANRISLIYAPISS